MKNKFNMVFLRIVAGMFLLPMVVATAVRSLFKGQCDEAIIKFFNINKKES